MDNPDFILKDAKIVLIGLGLMGGSLALSLKGRCSRLSALDLHQPTLDLALRQEVVHIAGTDPANILSDADLVILSCPVPAILDWVERLPDYIQHPCIVLDIGSTKRAIVAAFESLPSNFDPIGGHPICGREKLSLENAERFLYHEAPFVLTQLSRTSENARSAAVQIVDALGAKPVWLSADDHDRILAATSHLPYLLSSVLIHAAPEDAAPLIGPGFRSSARLAGTPSSMMLGVLHSNADNVLNSISVFRQTLDAVETALVEENMPELEAILDQSRSKYLRLNAS
ncbi:MAG: prephenate dehydrogenase [Anaerolineales bacterium]